MQNHQFHDMYKELRKLSKNVANVKSKTLIVDKKGHDAIIGKVDNFEPDW